MARKNSTSDAAHRRRIAAAGSRPEFAPAKPRGTNANPLHPVPTLRKPTRPSK